MIEKDMCLVLRGNRIFSTDSFFVVYSICLPSFTFNTFWTLWTRICYPCPVRQTFHTHLAYSFHSFTWFYR